ncbi:hypothetical protein [Arthrobacter sp. 18067]|nr:hypothetical protein [Arthrobacter sp. 18067]
MAENSRLPVVTITACFIATADAPAATKHLGTECAIGIGFS